MQIIDIARIIILPNRQRREFDPERLQGLQSSIGKVGLQNPIVVRLPTAEEAPVNAQRWVLVSGERRLRAVRDMNEFGEEVRYEGRALDPGQIPATLDIELAPLPARKAELEENLRRENLTWQEETAAIAEIDAVERKLAAANGTPAPALSDLAEDYLPPKRQGMEGSSQAEAVRRRILLAPHLGNPDVAKAKSVDEAFGVLKRADDAARHAEMARVVGASFSAKDHTLLQGDCIALMAGMEAERFDVILTDPPYGMDAQDFGDAGGRLVSQTHVYDDVGGADWETLMCEFARQSWRVAKAQAHAYVCCDIDKFHFLKNLMESFGWYVHRTPLINYKLDGSRVPLPENGPQRKWEMVLYAIKGWRKVTRIYSDVIETRGDENLAHGAQKPVSLYTNLLKRSARPGDTVLDPFCGTGTIYPASHELLCRATGIELDPVYAGIAAKRLQELK
jgi:DNA modification methylase/ParB-like chromosome segregation protein Spo0J